MLLSPQLQTMPCLPLQAIAPELVQLDFEMLTMFELVRDQYRHCGISFEGAIALKPSNPAFVPPSGDLVLMPTAKRNSIEVYFDRPMQQVGAIVMGMQQVKLLAFDRQQTLIGEYDMGGYQYVQEPDVQHPDLVVPLPQQKLELVAQDIHKVIFASDAPFIMDNFFCQ